ncbi:MAG: DUF2480 family protein [Calditrichae bacterium]|nr:DUF2480 family protein [Calditrichia bacterium]
MAVAKTRTIDIRDFFDNGIIREKSFREKIDAIDWKEFQDNKVVITGCDHADPNMGVHDAGSAPFAICQTHFLG